MRRRTFFISAICGLSATLLAMGVAVAAPLSDAQLEGLLERIDERQRSAGDYKAMVYIEQNDGDKTELVYKAAVYRRDREGKLVLMFLQPKSEAGKGYLRLEENLFLYDPNVGKWERRTDRENIGGTASQRRDFDASTFSEDYDPRYVAEEKLQQYRVHHLELSAKEGKNPAYPKMHVWVDIASGNPLKVEEYALSGKKMRTSYYPKWSKIASPNKEEPVYFPKEIYIYDEVEQGKSTKIVMLKVSLGDLEDNIFTKAWVESKSR